MKFLIAGLGNIGPEYADTRHNIGFMVVDALAKEAGVSFDVNTRHAFRAEVKHKGRTLILIKPTTYMNLSGKAVNYWLQQEKIPIENLMVVTDDLALPYGKIRIKGAGSDGGHNGFKSITEQLNTTTYPRLRFGIGSNFHRGQQSDYVLSPFNHEEQKELEARIIKSCDAIKSFVSIGLPQTMTQFNK